MLYVNRDSQRRVWPALRGADGRTLELGPGETVELDREVVDPHLVPANGSTVEPEPEEQPETVEEPAEEQESVEEPGADHEYQLANDNEEPQL